MKKLLTCALAALTLLGCVNASEISILPPSYATPANHRGTVGTFTYRTNGMEKTAYVYLPYGYETGNERYNILYFMHGGGGTASQFWKESYGGGYVLNNILDHAIEDGTIEPLIVVTPTFYPAGDRDTSVSNAGVQVKKFPAKFENDLMPAAESRYRTYAKSTDKKERRESRNHRAFGGFSMGSVTTWYEFSNALDYVAYFMPLSGDSWQFGTQGGRSEPEKTAAYLAEIAEAAKKSGNDFYIYTATGSDDIAYPALKNMTDAMKKKAAFTFGINESDGNITFQILKGGRHTYEFYRNYIISGLPRFFKE